MTYLSLFDFISSHNSFCSSFNWLGKVSTGIWYFAQNCRQRTKRRSYCPVESETELSIGGGCFFPVLMMRECTSFLEIN